MVAFNVLPALLLLMDIGADFLQREARLSQLHAEYRWFSGKAPYRADPFDRDSWIDDDPSNIESTIEAWIVRPNFRIHQRRRGFAPMDMENAWIDGRRTSKNLDPDGGWSVIIDQNRRTVTGPNPFLTPLELQTFDLQESLFDLVRGGALKVGAEDEARVTLVNGAVRLSIPWRITAVLNKTYDLAPEEIDAALNAPRGYIQWRMRTTRFDQAGETFVIGQALLAMNNELVDPGRWQIYLFDSSTYRHEPEMKIDNLRLSIPRQNVRLLNEIEGTYQHLNGVGKVIDQQRWDLEERKAQLAEAAQGWAQRQESIAALGRRRTLFGYSVSAAALLVIGLGVWAWKRR